MKVRYICDCCREIIAELDDPRLTEERLGIELLTPEEHGQLVQYDAETIVLSALCEECADVLQPADIPNKGVVVLH